MRRKPRFTAVVLAFVLVLWAGTRPFAAAAQSAGQVARSHRGMVAAAQPLASDAGARMLEMGGNAADAAVAAAFAIAVVEPTMNSIGGRNQILVRLPDGSVHGIDGTTQAPAGYDPDSAPQASYGYAVIGVPGVVAALMRLHEEYGSLSLETVMAPAIDYAERGFRLLPAEALRQRHGAERAAEFEGTREAYLKPDGTPYRAGDLLVQPDLARTLHTIRDTRGHDFYHGRIAHRIAEDIQAHGGAVTLESLERYRALDARIVRGHYRGFDLIGMDVPAAGVVSIQALQILENFERASMDAPAWATVVGQAVSLASRELRALGTDTASARALSVEWARRVARAIRVPAGVVPTGVGEGAGARGRLPGSAAHPELPALAARGDEHGHTTHLSTADSAGMFVSLTQTLGPSMGSAVVTPGLGFLYAATLGGYLGRMKGGARARSFISPLLVLENGRPVLVLGAAGGARIVSAVVQAVSHFVDDGLDLERAVAAPRVHMDFTGTLSVETVPDAGWRAAAVAEMRDLGFAVRPIPRPGAFGRIHGIRFDAATRTWIGVAEPDWEGTALAPSGS